ncbi:hypothetical protein PybrP1_000781 [[Pythium] brassicae (nom. inval.)]|nr:hypothetical protein PybrP1_000781 [[Pythium] brassicae (nom. inval.)]
MVELESHASGGGAPAAAAQTTVASDDGAPYGPVASGAQSVDAAQSEAPDALRLRLKLLDERVVEVAAARSMSIASFREAVAHATQVPVYRQRLIYRGKLLKDGVVLAAYDVRDGHTVHVVAKPSASASASGASSPAAAAAATAAASVTPPSAQEQQLFLGRREVATDTDDDDGSGGAGSALRRHREAVRRLMSSEDERSRDAGGGARSAGTMRRRSPGPGDPTGTAWNMGVLREALGGDRAEHEAAAAAAPPLHGLRDLFGDDALDDDDNASSGVAAAMGLSSSSSSHATGGPRPNLDHILQGVLTLRTVLSTAALPSAALERDAERAREQEMSFEDVDAPAAAAAAAVTSPATRRGHRRFFVGQWLDVKDTVNQWLESTVMAVSEDKVLVHYHGWPSRWDEWIDFDSDRLAAFRTRTVHTITATSHLSPAPVTRLPNAPSVGGRDVRDVVAALRDAMREMMPHVERFADLCEAPDRRPRVSLPHQIDFFDDGGDSDDDSDTNDDTDTGNEASTSRTEDAAATHAEELSEMAHLMAPMFDRFGRVLADSAHALEPLFAPELRSYNQQRQAQQARALAARGRPARQPASVPTALELRDTSLSVRDLISTVLRAPAESQSVRRNIDVHIHAILAPSSLQSFASLARAATSGGSLLETSNAPPTRRLRAPPTPPTAVPAFGLPSLREPLGGSDGRALVNDDAGDSDHSDRESVDHSRTPLLGSFRSRHDSRAGSSSATSRRRRAVDENLDSFLADDFFGTSFGNDSDEHDDAAAPANSRRPAASARESDSRFAYRSIPSPSDRDSRDALGQDSAVPTSASPTPLGVIPEVAEAEERARAQEASAASGDSRRRTDSEERVRGDSSASASSSSSSAGSESSSGSSYPSFLDSEEEDDNDDDDLPALEPSLSSSVSEEPRPVSNDRRASSSSDSSIEEEEDEEMDQVD